MWRDRVMFCKCNVCVSKSPLCRPGVEAGSRIFEQKVLTIIMPIQPHHKTELQLFWGETVMLVPEIGSWSPWWHFCSDKKLPTWPCESSRRRPQRSSSVVVLFNFYNKMNKTHISTVCSYSTFPLGLWHGKSREKCCLFHDRSPEIRAYVP